LVDAFTNQAFAGNPAAVVPLSAWREEIWLQSVASEMNLSETVYYVPTVEGFHIRWFTPQVEVNLCGHATLATAKVLAELGMLQDGQSLDFKSLSGVLRSRRVGNRFALDFPCQPVTEVSPPANLLAALKINPLFVGRNSSDYLIEVETEKEIEELQPEWNQLSQIDCRGVMVTTRSRQSEYDFISRFFAPAVGVNEDPVTGSAHCSLTEYWS
jgi:predicted PhzF superfamily epimerase YddE/YHI9